MKLGAGSGPAEAAVAERCRADVPLNDEIAADLPAVAGTPAAGRRSGDTHESAVPLDPQPADGRAIETEHLAEEVRPGKLRPFPGET